VSAAVQTELEKLDAIRSRMDVSYEEAREALNQADGDLVQALVNLEKGKGDLLSVGIELLDDIQRLMESGTVNKVRIKFGGRTITEYPVALTAFAALAVGLAAVIISKATIEIEQEERSSEGQA
ncbi:MAG TPA: DUF4342 domain-containing protein, partial [Armatimonadota bacterium]|jgi:hypothetical protein|nr:DUF4342 domain-containing protein [Armatimonadota bacterium]